MEIIFGLLLLPGGVHVCGGGEGGGHEGEVGPAVLGVGVSRVLALQGGHPAIPANKILLPMVFVIDGCSFHYAHTWIKSGISTC